MEYRLSFNGDPKRFVGLQCKARTFRLLDCVITFVYYVVVSKLEVWFEQVYWPLDDDWYSGSVVGYNSETDRHHVMIVLSI